MNLSNTEITAISDKYNPYLQLEDINLFPNYDLSTERVLNYTSKYVSAQGVYSSASEDIYYANLASIPDNIEILCFHYYYI